MTQDWLDSDPAQLAHAPIPERAPAPIEAAALQLREVSPSWAEVALTDRDLPDGMRLPGISRDRAIGVEAIREGWLLHRGASRIAPEASPDLALLVGDWCYANGLCAIADHGTLDDVEHLARLIADVSAQRATDIEALEPRWTTTIEALQDA